MLVCRRWNLIATPFLYEHIRLNEIRFARQLLDTLLSQAGERLGPLILRLDLVGDGIRWGIDQSRSESLTATDEWPIAPRICIKCPNLVTLVTESEGTGEPLIVEILPPTLRHICFSSSFKHPLKSWLDFLDKHPALESIDPPQLAQESFHGVPIEEGKQRPSVKQLTVNGPISMHDWSLAFPRGSFPNLQHLIIRSPIEPRDARIFSKFLVLHGRNVETILLTGCDPRPDALAIPAVLFPLLSKVCPKLNRLVWSVVEVSIRDVWKIRELPVNHPQLPNVTIFEVEFEEHPSCIIVDLLYQWVRCLPHVRKIILSEADADALPPDDLQKFVPWVQSIGRDRGVEIVVVNEYDIPII